jgi:hypothetical protein
MKTINTNGSLDSQGDNWNDLLKEVVTFNSVEEFWGIYVCFLMAIFKSLLLADPP